MPKIVKILGETITFDDTNNRHLFSKGNGEILLSVTAATGVVDKSAALIGWAVRLGKEYLLAKIDNGEQITVLDINEAANLHRIKKEEAGNIGDKIHAWVNEWIAGQNPAMPEEEKVRNGAMAFLQFQKENKVKWIENSRVVYSKRNNYAGILDAVGKIKNKLALIDFKSSNAIYKEYGLQVAGYQIAYEEETKKKIKYRLIIKFGKDTGDFEWRKFENNKGDKEGFLACLTLKRWLIGKPR